MDETTHPRRRRSRRSHRRRSSSDHNHGLATGWGTRGVLLATLAISPWLFGSVDAWAYRWIFAGIALAVGLWIVHLVSQPRSHDAVPFLGALLGLALLFGFMQTLPLPGKLAHTFAGDVQQREKLLATFQPLSSSEIQPQLAKTISVYPAATYRTMSLLIAAVAAFFLGSSFFRTRNQQLALAWVLAINGSALAFFGLVQKLTWNGMIYWTVPLQFGGGPFGPFVSRNSAAGYLNLCLAGAVALIIWSLREDGPPPEQAGEKPAAKLKFHLLGFVGSLNVMTLSAIAMAGLIIGGILASESRGGILSAAGGLVVAGACLSMTGSRLQRAWAVVIAVLFGFGLLIWVGLDHQVGQRMNKMLDDPTGSGRVPHWQDALKAFPDFWKTGSGLGTYQFVYTAYQERLASTLFTHAENQYLEALIEGGVPGLLLLLSAIILVFHAGLTLIKNDAFEGRAFGFAWLIAIGSQVVHANFDFGLYLPSNFLLLAVICGAVCGRAVVLDHGIFPAPFVRFPRARGSEILAGIAVILLSLCGWSWHRATVTDAREKAIAAARALDWGPQLTAEQLRPVKQILNAALRANWFDAECHLQMAEALVHEFRLKEGELQQRADVPARSLWPRTDLMFVYRAACNYARSNNKEDLQRLRDLPHVVRYLRPAYHHLQAACQSCPLMPRVHVLLGELSFLEAIEQNNSALAVRELAPGDPDFLFTAGLLDYYQGRPSAYLSFRKALRLSTAREDDIIRLSLQRLDFRDLMEYVLPRSPEYLLELAKRKYTDSKYTAERQLLARKALSLVPQTTKSEAEQLLLTAQANALLGDIEQALQQYQKALLIEPNEPQWRFDYAQLLWTHDRPQEALEQVKVCVRMRPDNTTYQALLSEIERFLLRQPAGSQ